MTSNDDTRTTERKGDDAFETTRHLQLTRRNALALGGTTLGLTALGGTGVGGNPAAQEEDGTDDEDENGTGDEDENGTGDEDENGTDERRTDEYRVTVTNLSAGQPFTPPLVALHQPQVEVFSVGDPANEAVRQLAENGTLDPLVTLAGETSEIRAAAVGDRPLVPEDDPGGTGNPYYTELTLSADRSATHLTFLSMLVGTNDGFVGLDTVELPDQVNESRTLHANAYDAGTEQNTELFEDMVPPAQSLIQGGEPQGGTDVSDPEIAEDDVIRPHPGIQGDGDLSPEVYGWDEPVGAVHVEKTAGGLTPEVLYEFDRANPAENYWGQLPENVTVDEAGNKYVSVSSQGQLWKFSPDNELPENPAENPYAQFSVSGAFLVGTVGVEADAEGSVYTCFASDLDDIGGSDTNGVWRVDAGGDRELVAELPPDDYEGLTFPNDLVVYDDFLLVTDSFRGVVYRVWFDGEAEVWGGGPLLAPTEGGSIGADGIAVGRDGTVYVTNLDRGYVVEIPVGDDGTAGTPALFVDDDLLVGSDGIAFDVENNLYVAVNGQNAIRRVSPDGDIETLATGGDLDSPAGVAFGTTSGQRETLFVTNLALPSSGPGPSFMKLDVGVPGLSTQQ
jgi:sugar lactone lactonase YvrE